MCANNNIKRIVNVKNCGLKLQIKEKVFIKIMKKQQALTSILKGFLRLKNDITIENNLIVDNIEINYKINEDTVVIEDVTIPRKWEGNKEKLWFAMTDHFLTQIFERKLNVYDWSILCNVYKNILHTNYEIGKDIELCNNNSTIIFSFWNDYVTLITGWNGSRNKKLL